MTPTVSVMMAAYNTRDYIEEAVESVLGQSFQDFELLIIDDGSTDGTAELLRTIASRDRRIQWRSRPNAGIVPTRNELLAMARGEFVAVLDSDDLWPPRRLEISVEYLQRRPDILALGGDVQVIDEEGAQLCVWELKRSPAAIDAALMQGKLAICHSAATIRRGVLAEIGGYRDSHGFGGKAQDLDMWLRISELGAIANLPEIMAHYRVRLASISIADAEQQAGAAEAIILAARKRRNVTSEVLAITAAPDCAKIDIFVRWGWWALGSGHVRTAWKYARYALRENPVSSKAWKLMLCMLRGHKGSRR